MNSVKHQGTYILDTCDENDDIETCNINFVTWNFNGQATAPTDNCQTALFSIFYGYHQLIQSPFANIVKSMTLLYNFAGGFITDFVQIKAENSDINQLRQKWKDKNVQYFPK